MLPMLLPPLSPPQVTPLLIRPFTTTPSGIVSANKEFHGQKKSTSCFSLDLKKGRQRRLERNFKEFREDSYSHTSPAALRNTFSGGATSIAVAVDLAYSTYFASSPTTRPMLYCSTPLSSGHTHLSLSLSLSFSPSQI
ncbi:hypothetical protein LOK49_LG01G03820 [Camellia lanceoleosa]|uniref:Uncharacterized protein n=1 Tax=Camellia lanceoleosa TaxID=1840588 RepID=A0ACC0J3L7_9ERIC|nr:hypothetical protein LOK49_LG01G03820 [Camellia lanceoleosa]